MVELVQAPRRPTLHIDRQEDTADGVSEEVSTCGFPDREVRASSTVLRTHGAAADQGRSVALHGTKGGAPGGQATSEEEIHVGLVVLDDRWIRWDGNKGQRAGAIGQHSSFVVPHGQATDDGGPGSVAEVETDGIVLDDEFRRCERDGSTLVGGRGLVYREATIWLYPVDATDEAPLELTTGIEPMWSGDGSYVYFLRNYPEDTELWKMRADGGEPEQFVARLGAMEDDFYDVSPRGDVVWVRQDESDKELWVLELPPVDG